MRDREVDFPRLFVAGLQEPLDPRLQAVDAGRRLRQQTARLVDDQNRSVLQQDRETFGLHRTGDQKAAANGDDGRRRG